MLKILLKTLVLNVSIFSEGVRHEKQRNRDPRDDAPQYYQ